MNFDTHFNANWLNQLINNPQSTISGQFNTSSYSARIALPDYPRRLQAFYSGTLQGDIYTYSNQVEIPYAFNHFGVLIEFSEPTELELHDEGEVLNEGLRQIIARVGPVIIRNAYMVAKYRDRGHRNRFPHLNFHIDRSANQPTQYSMYTRNPFDAEQQFPRTSSTLFAPSIIGNLQSVKEGQPDATTDKGMRGTYTIFTKENMEAVLGNVVLEHPWNEPKGVGEISMLDNRTTLHASYYRDLSEKGYKIGVRYLA